MREKKRGLSLIEVLVMIAIIAILAGLILPVVASVRDKNRLPDKVQTQWEVRMDDGRTIAEISCNSGADKLRQWLEENKAATVHWVTYAYGGGYRVCYSLPTEKGK